MSKPTPGRPYTVVDGDTLSSIAAQSYGDGSKWRTIWQANESRLRSGDPNLIFPGEVINVPLDADVETQFKTLSETVRGAGQDLTVVIGDREMVAQSASVFRSMDTAADGWAITRLWDPSDTELYNLVNPYTYAPAQAYIGGVLVVTGYVYKVSPNTGDRTITIDGWSKTADMIDSTLKVGTLEAQDVTLRQRAEQLAEPHSIKVDYRLDDDTVFDRVTADSTETIGEHIGKLCRQRRGLLTSSRTGDLVITQAVSGDSEPVAALVENTPPLLPIGASFDGRQRFATYRVIARNGRKTKEAFSRDQNINSSRFTTTNAPDARAGDIQGAADWERNRQAADSMAMELPVMDWYDSNGELWEENTIITLQAPALFIQEPTPFLIRAVRFTLDGSEGRRATLSVVPPTVYTDGNLVEPWFAS